jgi:ubiquinone/menaquinone biosynthesis C-methylase UbiE
MWNKLKKIFKKENHFYDEGEIDSTLEDAYLSGWFLNESKELFKGFKINPEDSVLDIGCGDGSFSKFCAKMGAEVIFADINSKNIEQTKRILEGSNSRSLIPIITDGNPIPLENERVNRVIVMEVLEHVDDPKKFMDELVRVAKKESLFLVSVPDVRSENVLIDVAPKFYFESPNHIRIFSLEEFKNLLINSGLEIISIHTYGFYWSMWWFFFWTCNQEYGKPLHPLLQKWNETWNLLLRQENGKKVKETLDNTLPKSIAIIAKKVR